jgi:hypothetical protein
VAPDERFTWLSDVTPADWLKPRLHPFLQDTGSVVPVGFEAYCRVFHPVEQHGYRRRWADIAAENHKVVHPEMQFHAISQPPGRPMPSNYERGTGPNWGSLPLPERFRLTLSLRPATTTPDRCWFCVWDGFGLEFGGVSERVRLPNRDYLLYSGPVELSLASFDPPLEETSPNLWWPQDRAWVVATDIDYAWTYVGGTSALVEELLSDDGIEALPAKLTDNPFYYGDDINQV